MVERQGEDKSMASRGQQFTKGQQSTGNAIVASGATQPPQAPKSTPQQQSPKSS